MATIIQLLCIISRSGANESGADRRSYRQALTQLILQMQSSQQIWQPPQAAEQASAYAEVLADTWPELRHNAHHLTADCLYDWFNHRLQAKILERSLMLELEPWP